MTQHTKGPWTAREYASPSGNWFIRGPRNEKITSGPGLTEGNAKIIAAAPALKEALEKLLAADRDFLSGDNHCVHCGEDQRKGDESHSPTCPVSEARAALRLAEMGE